MKSAPHYNIAVSGYGCISAAGMYAGIAHKHLEEGLVANRLLGTDFFPGEFVAPCFQIQSDWQLSSAIGKGEKGNPFGEPNRTIRLALTAISEALLQAGLQPAMLQEKRVGIALGTTVGCTFHNEEYYRFWKQGNTPDPLPLFSYLSSNLAVRVQEILGVSGPRAMITNACASGTDAIGVAKTWLELGLCDIAIAGGADELSRIACHGFKSLMLVSDVSCTPFARDRQGLNLGEGAGVVVLETESHAAERNAQVHGWIRGYGIAGDAYHPTAPHPDGRGLQLAIAQAMLEAGVRADEIAMINAHGTGTPANDRAETNALAALGFEPSLTPVVSTKGGTGHTLGAAGGIEAVFTLMALNEGRVTGTVGCSEPDPDLAFTVLKQGERASLRGRVGISQSLAFGGSNSALVIEGAGL